jgi:amino acid transporter
LLVGVLSVAAPLFGRKALVWLVDAGGLGIIVAYGMVALSFLILRRKEPQMNRPFMVKHGNLVGYAALLLSAGIAVLYLPGSPAALVWPQEWAIFLGWTAFGAVLYLWALSVYGRADASKIVREEIITGHSDLTPGAEPLRPPFP